MSGSRLFATSAFLAFALLLSPTAFSQDAKALAQQAGAAYEAKDFANAGKLYDAAAMAGPAKATNYYNAACSYALAGQVDEAFRALNASMDAGLSGDSPALDPDFKSLHADPRWAPLMARYEAAHPEMAALKIMKDGSKSAAQHYAAGRAAIAAGASITDTNSFFNQVYANQAQFVGEYDEAGRVYGAGNPVDDVVGTGYTRARDALPVVLAQAKGRQAVFVNESHGRSETRAANYALLAGLRAQGFDVLAMEALSNEKVARDATHCSSTALGDPGLPARGYALSTSGYYTRDPVYAETVREALRLGFRLVAYDSTVEGGVPAREQNQAENLACVFKQDPKARLVVIAGFSHIGERKDFWVPGGAMAYRFRQVSGIDPLTVDTTSQLYLDPSKLSFADSGQAASYVLEDAKGKVYGTDNFDLVLYVPGGAHRDDGKPSWLSLGGARRSTHVDMPACRGVATCILQARRVGEQADAVAADACVVSAPATGCNLFLRPGRYDVVAESAEAMVARVPVTVDER